MKRNLLNFLGFVLILFTLINFQAKAQTLNNFKAKDGYSFALKIANDSLNNNADLYAIASVSQTLSGFNLSLDIKSGGANNWVYSFKNKLDPSQGLTIVVLKVSYPPLIPPTFIDPVGAKIITQAQINAALAPYKNLIPTKPLDLPNCDDSDDMATKINANTDYQSLSAHYPKATPQTTALGVNQLDLSLKIGQPYWSIVFTDTTLKHSFSCAVNAASGETICQDQITKDVKEMIQGTLGVYPNPSNDGFYINTESIQSDVFDTEIIDIAGNSIFKKHFQNGEKQIYFPGYMLNNGEYFIKINAGNKSYLEKIVVAK